MNKLLRPKKNFCISNASNTFKEIYASYLNDENLKKVNIELIKHPTKNVLEEVIKQRKMKIDPENDLFSDLINKDDLDLDAKKVLKKYKNDKNQIYNEDEEDSKIKKMSKKYLLSFNGKKIKKKLKLNYNSSSNYLVNFNKNKKTNGNIGFVSLSPTFTNKNVIQFPKIFSSKSKNKLNFNQLESMREKMKRIEIENSNFNKNNIKRNLKIKSLSQGNMKIRRNILDIKNTFYLNPQLKGMESLINKLGNVCKKSKSIIKNINIFSETEQCFLDKKKRITMKLVKKY